MGREPILMAGCGRKGVGKSHKTMEYIRDYVNKSPRRKALIFDVNNEYSDKAKFPDISTIAIANIKEYANQRRPEIRRIAPFFDDGRKMTLNDMAELLKWLVRNYYNGLLLIEDVNKYVADTMPGDLIGAICTNRHAGVDIILHYQSIGRLSPKIWQNINVLRMHKNTDSVDRHENKFPDKYECMKIAEHIINKQVKMGNIRYYLFVDFDNEKIHPMGVSKEDILEAISLYISENYSSIVSPMVNRVGLNGARSLNHETAFVQAMDERYEQYFS